MPLRLSQWGISYKLSVPKMLWSRKLVIVAIRNRTPEKSRQFYVWKSGTFDLSLLFQRQKHCDLEFAVSFSNSILRFLTKLVVRVAICNMRFENAVICDCDFWDAKLISTLFLHSMKGQNLDGGYFLDARMWVSENPRSGGGGSLFCSRKVLIVSRTLSGVFFVGPCIAAKEGKDNSAKMPGKPGNPEKAGKSRNGQRSANRNARAKLRKHRRFKPPSTGLWITQPSPTSPPCRGYLPLPIWIMKAFQREIKGGGKPGEGKT